MPMFTAVTRPTLSASGGVTVSQLNGSSLGRGFVRGLTLSVEGQATDAVINWRVDRFSAAGGASAMSNIGYADPGDVGNNRITAKQNSTVEPTYTSAYLWQASVNTRVTYSVPVPPTGWAIATASGGGIGVFANATVSGLVCDVVWRWDE